MSIDFSTTYWLLGEGAEEEAKRWVVHDQHKKIMYSSPNAVEIVEGGKYLVPELPFPPKGFLLVIISHNEADPMGVTLGVSNWSGDGGWIGPKEDQAVSPVDPMKHETATTQQLDHTTEDVVDLGDTITSLIKDQPRAVVITSLAIVIGRIISAKTTKDPEIAYGILSYFIAALDRELEHERQPEPVWDEVEKLINKINETLGTTKYRTSDGLAVLLDLLGTFVAYPDTECENDVDRILNNYVKQMLNPMSLVREDPDDPIVASEEFLDELRHDRSILELLGKIKKPGQNDAKQIRIITVALEQAVSAGDLGAIANIVTELKQTVEMPSDDEC